MTLRLRAAAVRDLDDIFDYGVATHGLAAAERYARTLHAGMERLVAHPWLGQAREFGPDLRALSVERHLIFYIVEGREIVVLRVLHQTMDVSRHLQ